MLRIAVLLGLLFAGGSAWCFAHYYWHPRPPTLNNTFDGVGGHGTGTFFLSGYCNTLDEPRKLLFVPREPSEPFARGVCAGYVLAIADVMFGSGRLRRIPIREEDSPGLYGIRACIPSVTADQIVDAVAALLADDSKIPNLAPHMPMIEVVARALAQAFPCNK